MHAAGASRALEDAAAAPPRRGRRRRGRGRGRRVPRVRRGVREQPQHLRGRLRPARRSPRQAAQDERREQRRHRRRPRAVRRRAPLQPRRDIGRGARGPLPDQHLVEHQPERVQIAARVHRPARRLLGRHVARRAQGALGERRVVVEAARDAEVGEHHAPAPLEQHVARLEIAVDHPGRVGGAQPLGDGAADAHRGRDREPRLRSQQRAQRVALDELHGQVEQPLGLAEIVDRILSATGSPRERSRAR